MEMNDSETLVENKEAEEPGMIEAALEFWFRDSEHIRSPFPFYIQDELSTQATEKFLVWTKHVRDDAKEEVNDEILAEKFEEILFELGLKMVMTEDEKITIRYPFMPRIDDIIKVKELVPDAASESKVIDRWHFKKGDESFLKVKLRRVGSGEVWETEFELPE